MNIIFDGVYSAALTNQAIKEGLLFDSQDKQIPENYYSYSNKYRIKALELLLISDTVKFTMSDSNINFDNLTKSGFIDIHSYATYVDSEWKQRTKYLSDFKFISDLDFYKPIIINHIYDSVKNKDGMKYFSERKVSFKGFLSIAIDKLTNKNIDEDYLKRCGYALWDNQPAGLKMYSWEHLLATYFADYIFPVSRYILELLNFSFDNKYCLSSTIINQTNLNKLNKEQKNIEARDYIKSYDILMYSLKDLIGYLPKLETIEQVIRIKENKHKQIISLKNTIEEIRVSLKEGNISALKKAVLLLDKAKKDLNHNQNITKISSWTTYISLPVSVIETVFGIPPVIGLSLGTISIVNNELSKRIMNENWISIYRG